MEKYIFSRLTIVSTSVARDQKVQTWTETPGKNLKKRLCGAYMKPGLRNASNCDIQINVIIVYYPNFLNSLKNPLKLNLGVPNCSSIKNRIMRNIREFCANPTISSKVIGQNYQFRTDSLQLNLGE